VPPHGGTIDLIIERNQALLKAELEWLDRSMDRAAAIRGMYQWDGILADRQAAR